MDAADCCMIATAKAKEIQMHATRIDLSQSVRQKVISLLQARLADSLDLKLSVKQAHWNVKGPGFIQLHELFDDIAGRAEDLADGLAERITSLGGTALGRVQQVAQQTTLAAYPDDRSQGPAHVAALADRIAAVAKGTRAAITACSEAGDEVTADLFNETTGILDKDLWLLEAHLQSPA
jgi:starvation-inducible DNA-binding protein